MYQRLALIILALALVQQFPDAAGRRFGVLVESHGPQIVVERSLYGSPNGVTFDAGARSVATSLPPVP